MRRALEPACAMARVEPRTGAPALSVAAPVARRGAAAQRHAPAAGLRRGGASLTPAPQGRCRARAHRPIEVSSCAAGRSPLRKERPTPPPFTYTPPGALLPDAPGRRCPRRPAPHRTGSCAAPRDEPPACRASGQAEKPPMHGHSDRTDHQGPVSTSRPSPFHGPRCPDSTRDRRLAPKANGG